METKDKIKIQYKPISIKDLFINKDIYIPPYQRGIVWKESQKCYLIETVLLSYAIPPLVFIISTDENENEIWNILDGQQRCSAIQDFLNDRFVMMWKKSTKKRFENNEAITEIINLTDGKKFSEIKEKSRSWNRIMNYELVYMDIDNSNENNEDFREIFTRINSISVVLNSQELRKAKYYSSNMISLYKLSDNIEKLLESTKTLTKTQISRAYDVEMISSIYLTEDEGDLTNITSKNLDNFAEKMIDFDEDKFGKRIEKIIKNCSDLLYEFSKVKIERNKIFGRYYFELFYFLVFIQKEIKEDIKDIIKFIKWINLEENSNKREEFKPVHTRDSNSRKSSIKIYYEWKNKWK